MADEETKDKDQPVIPQGPSAILGLVLVINGKEVTLNSDTITDIQKKGLDLGITEPVYLGTFSQMIDEIKKTFNVDIPTNPEVVPPPLDGFLKNVENLGVTIVKAHIKVPPAPAEGRQQSQRNTRW